MKNKIVKTIIINKVYIFLSLFFIISTIFITLVLSYLYKIYMMDSSIDGTFSRDTIYFKVSGIQSADFEFVIDDNKSFTKTNLIVQSDNKMMLSYEVISMGADINDIEGESFSSYYTDGSNTAIVGKKLHEIKDINNLIIDSQSYKVIGEINNNTDSVTGDYNLYFCNGNIKNIGTSNVFILSGINKKDIQNAYEKIKSELSSQGAKFSEIIPDNISFSDFVQYRSLTINIFLMTIAIILISQISIAVFWMNSLKQYISVCIIIGKRNTYLNIFRNFLMVSILSQILGYVTTVAVSNDIRHNIMILLFTVLFGVLISSFSIATAILIYRKQNIKVLLENDYE